MRRFHASLYALLTAWLAAPSLQAQFQNQTLTLGNKQLSFAVHDKLAAVPMQLGAEGPHYIARFEPSGEGDYIYNRYGQFSWQLYVLDFPSADLRARESSAPVTGDGDDSEPSRPTEEQLKELLRARMKDRGRAENFAEWVREKDPGRGEKREVTVDGKVKKGSGSRPTYAWWEYADPADRYGGKVSWQMTAAAYDLEDREVVLLTVLPTETGERLDSKYRGIVNKMLQSLRVTELSEEDSIDQRRDEFANTPARKKALDLLKGNIGDLKNWDYFTTPNYMFTYSWHPEKPETRRDMLRFTIEMRDRLEEIREKFVEFYPPHENVGDAYSVIRICFDLDEFHKYGDTRYGVVGWFSPMSKELVIYYDQKKVFLKDEDEMLAVCYHEAWHQYSDQYFPGVELHRWYDEGLAEYFGSLRKKGRRWSHVFHDGRLDSLAKQDRAGTLIPSADIVTWHKDKFYSARAADHYAQAYAMLDFLIRGEETLGKRWNERWSEILPIYTKTCLEERSETKAVQAAFDGVDWAAFETGWKEWFQKDSIKRR